MCDVIDRVRSNARAEGIEQGIEQGIERGREQGMEQGVAQGTQQERERNVLALVLAGRTDQEIAEWLHLDAQYIQDVRRNNAE